jgi:hypothetical protein
MNWLESHLRSFVFPMLQYWFSNGVRIPEGKDFYKGEIRPANDCQFPETGMLKAFLKSTGLWKTYCTKKQGYVSSLLYARLNLEKEYVDRNSSFKNFVPSFTDDGTHSLLKFSQHSGFTEADILHTTVKNSVKNLRALTADRGCKVVLLGRDVWIWSVLCEKMGVPYVYTPIVSRLVAREFYPFVDIVRSLNLKEGDIVFDTGFAGTIYRAVKDIVRDVDIECIMFSAHDKQFQQFKNHGLARNRALCLEYLPKYFKTGTVRNERAVQELADLESFVDCALLTIWAWHYESPTWITGPRYHTRRKGMEMFRSTNVAPY